MKIKIYRILKSGYRVKGEGCRIKPFAFACLFLFTTAYTLLPTPCLYGAASGGQAGQFLSWGAGARALAMGKAFLAVSDDASAAYWNPAGLTQLERKEFTGLYAKLWYDTAYSFISYAHPTTKYGVFGISLVSLTSEKFEKVTIERNTAGDVVVFNDNLGDFSDAQMAYIGAYAKDLSKKLAFGASAKYVAHVIDIYKVASELLL